MLVKLAISAHLDHSRIMNDLTRLIDVLFSLRLVFSSVGIISIKDEGLREFRKSLGKQITTLSLNNIILLCV